MMPGMDLLDDLRKFDARRRAIISKWRNTDPTDLKTHQRIRGDLIRLEEGVREWFYLNFPIEKYKGDDAYDEASDALQIALLYDDEWDPEISTLFGFNTTPESIDRAQHYDDDRIRRWDDFVDTLKRFITETKPEKRQKEVERFTIEGVDIVYHAWERGSLGDTPVKSMKRAAKDLKRAFQDIKKAGFGIILRNLTLVVRHDPQSGGDRTKHAAALGGRYYTDSRKLEIFLSLFGKPYRSTVHELGHRLYFEHLSSRARKRWRQVFNSQEIEITSDDVAMFLRKFELPTSSSKFRRKIRSVSSDVLRRKFQWLWDNQYDILWPAVRKEHGSQDLDWCRANPKQCYRIMLRDYDPVSIPFEIVSEYGLSNPDEHFAEAFTEYVSKGPRAVPPMTRAIFRDMVKDLRGVRLKESLVQRIDALLLGSAR